jgi:hypothetical protein
MPTSLPIPSGPGSLSGSLTKTHSLAVSFDLSSVRLSGGRIGGLPWLFEHYFIQLGEYEFPRRPPLGRWVNTGNSLLGTLVQVWLRKPTQNESRKDKATPQGYKSAPSGYRYLSQTPSSSPNYYPKRVEPEEAPDSSRWLSGRRVFWVVLIAVALLRPLSLTVGLEQQPETLGNVESENLA